MQQIGWSLVTLNVPYKEIMFWGDTAGAEAGIPNPIKLPNGDLVYGAQPLDVLGNRARIVPRFLQAGSPESVAVDVSQVLVTRTPPARLIPKSVIVRRLNAANLLDAGLQALQQNTLMWALWIASDLDAVDSDNPNIIAWLQSIGADPSVILG
jgi:hypothetical protein